MKRVLPMHVGILLEGHAIIYLEGHALSWPQRTYRDDTFVFSKNGDFYQEENAMHLKTSDLSVMNLGFGGYTCNWGKDWISICLYGINRFPGDLIMKVLQVHPFAITGGVSSKIPILFILNRRGIEMTSMTNHAESRYSAVYGIPEIPRDIRGLDKVLNGDFLHLPVCHH